MACIRGYVLTLAAFVWFPELASFCHWRGFNIDISFTQINFLLLIHHQKRSKWKEEERIDTSTFAPQMSHGYWSLQFWLLLNLNGKKVKVNSELLEAFFLFVKLTHEQPQLFNQQKCILSLVWEKFGICALLTSSTPSFFPAIPCTKKGKGSTYRFETWAIQDFADKLVTAVQKVLMSQIPPSAYFTRMNFLSSSQGCPLKIVLSYLHLYYWSLIYLIIVSEEEKTITYKVGFFV